MRGALFICRKLGARLAHLRAHAASIDDHRVRRRATLAPPTARFQSRAASSSSIGSRLAVASSSPPYPLSAVCVCVSVCGASMPAPLLTILLKS